MMPRRPLAFRQCDISRAIKGAQIAGIQVSRVEIDSTGKIVLFAKSDHSEPPSVLEQWKRDHARTS